MRVDDLIASFPEFDSKVFFGGPVQTDTIHYIHNVGDLLEDSVKVIDGIYWGGNFEKLKFLIQSEMIKPENIRFFVGYSGWTEGHLMDEMGWGPWVLANMYANYLFKSAPKTLWKQIMQNKGDVFSVIAQMPEGMDWNQKMMNDEQCDIFIINIFYFD